MSTPDGPRFLTAPPQATQPSVEVAQQPAVPPVRTRPPARPGDQTTRPKPKRVVYEGPPIGDRAGEHLEMARGTYGAWTYVVIAFVLLAAILGILPRLALIVFLPDDAATVGAAVIGGAFAWLVFRDRFRCNEAFSSRFCFGLMNLSILYVPLISLVYGVSRGLAKLSRS